MILPTHWVPAMALTTIYVPQTSLYQNIEKLLTHPSILIGIFDLSLVFFFQAVKCFDWVVRTSSDIAIKRVSLHEIQKYRNQDSSVSFYIYKTTVHILICFILYFIKSLKELVLTPTNF